MTVTWVGRTGFFRELLVEALLFGRRSTTWFGLGWGRWRLFAAADIGARPLCGRFLTSACGCRWKSIAAYNGFVLAVVISPIEFQSARPARPPTLGYSRRAFPMPIETIW